VEDLMRRAPYSAALACALLLVAAVPRVHACLVDSECANGSLCDGIERCIAGACQAGSALQCDDGDACTVDTCNPAAGCVHQDTACPTSCGPGDDGSRCSDGTACTVGDTCAGGACVGAPVNCDDGDPCTTDTCDAALGCVYVEEANPPTCVSDCHQVADHTRCPGDGNPCTLDGCLEGACQIGLVQVVRQCDDGDRCNGDEFCSPVKGCQPGPPPVCDDDNPCNGVESCVPASGCQAGTPAADGTSCDDGQLCTLADACSAGTCAGTADPCDDGNATTSDLCIEPSGCLHCTPMTSAKLTLTFPAAPKPGKFTLKGAFSPPVPLDPTSPTGVDLLLHDGTSVFQASHVPPANFVANAAGTSDRFRDKTGTIASGLEKLQLKSATATRPGKVTAKGKLTGDGVGGNTSNAITVIAGPACTTTTLPCTLVHRGKARRCQLP
jgi:hypothetical protein